ncbi:MAG: ornithine carbamoyltransferase [Candidatus Omnitrophica bacterium]|nr:ornithine carbamoyltransferase [Candidatus Omnitrophota bacterium]
MSKAKKKQSRSGAARRAKARSSARIRRGTRTDSSGRDRRRRPQSPAALFAAKDFLTIKEATADDLAALFKLADKMKRNPEIFLGKLKGKSLAMLFQKPSIRTRVSLEVGISELGGLSVYMDPQELPLGERESIKDVARVLSRYCDVAVVRTYHHSDTEEFARHATIPVINGLSDGYHPCQTLADLFTIREKFGSLEKMNIAYIGDGNNVLNSLLYGAGKVGANLAVATPRGYEPSEEVLKEIKLICKESGSKITLSNNPFTAIKNAHAVYTDVWVSMGQEKQREQRLRDFQPFQLNGAIISKAPKDAMIMHCLPAHRGEEITDEAMEHPRSAIFDQAENRLHTQKALLYLLLTRKRKK